MLVIDGTSGDESAGVRKETSWTSGPSPAQTTVGRPNRGIWHSINGACEILGVDQSTLRRWSDRGLVPVFRTPGGHRRYNEQDLIAFLAGDSARHRRVSPGQLAAFTRDEFERRGSLIAAGRLAGGIHPGDYESELRATCDRMIDASVLYASGIGEADQLLLEARTLAGRFGRCTSSAGLDASGAVESFLQFRRPIFDALGRYLEQQNLSIRRCCRTFGKLNAYFDVMLTSLVEAHEVHSRE
jgi:excisionase family DNA binding protein